MPRYHTKNVLLLSRDKSIRLPAVCPRWHLQFVRTFHPILILQKMCQRDKTVQPIGNPLPAFSFSSDPGTVTNIRPYFIQIAAQPLRLYLQLPVQPPFRFYFRSFKIVVHVVSFFSFTLESGKILPYKTLAVNSNRI